MDEDKNETAPIDRLAEVKVMGKLAEALAGLEPDAVARVLRWAADAYGVVVGGSGKGRSSGAGSVSGTGGTNGNGNGSDVPVFASLAELYHATTPESDADKTLVGGYWAQYGEGKAEFGAQEVNAALKNLGHTIGNITGAFNNLKNRKPAPVMQLKKAGTTKQARKTFKLTLAGKTAVEAMVHQG